MHYHVIDYLQQEARSIPNQIALSDASDQLTYLEVMNIVSRAGRAIASGIGQRNQPIVVCINHSVRDVLSFFSIAFSGNFYVPIDPGLPAGRIQDMVDTVQPAAVLTSDSKALPFQAGSIPVWTLEQLAAGAPDGPEPWKNAKDTDLLYVMFTSGSTGIPKGVAICHRSVIDMVEQFQAVFHFPEHSVFGNQAPFDFDVSVKDIYLSLKVGGRLEILEKKLFSFPKLLIQRLNERQVDTIIWAVPALKIISSLRAFHRDKPRFLRDIMFSGEVMPPKTLAYWREALPNARFVNLYGPTEITCNCTYHILDGQQDPDAPIPIGKAFPNCSVFLLDDREEVQEENRLGEICVTGTCLARGYYRRPDLTEKAFAQNPLCDALPEPMYRTGDLGCYQNGRLIFMGRTDTQIKHMGHRIELGEVELCANGSACVESAACVYDQEYARILLFYLGTCPPEQLSAVLQKKLPRYMLPNRIYPVTVFPQTRTGKIDRRKLLELAKERTTNGKTLSDPS